MKNRQKIFRIIVAFLIICIILLIAKIIIQSIYWRIEDASEQFELPETDITEKTCFPDNVYGVTVHNEIIDIDNSARKGIKRKIKYIVIHETNNYNKMATAAGHAAYLKISKNSTSWHYTVDETEIYHHIPDNEIANHAGERTGNRYGIGIELCVNDGSDFEKTFDNAAKLVAYLLKEYDLNINSIKTHNDFSGSYCPRRILSNGRFDEFKNKVLEYYSK